MRAAALSACLALWALAACSTIPGNGPLAGAVLAQAQSEGQVLFDVVPVDGRVIAALEAAPHRHFASRFKKYGKPPDLKVAVGDTLEVLVWESGAAGLLAPSPPPAFPAPGPVLPVPRFTPTFRPGIHSAALAPAVAAPMAMASYTATLPPQLVPRFAPAFQPARHSAALAAVAAMPSGAASLPPQLVQPDGTITVPYAGRVAAAGHTVTEVQQEIEARLAGSALSPQALVIDLASPANSVSASGRILKGGRIALSPGGERLLQVIAAAGGARAPVRNVFVRLSRGPLTATIPLATLVSDPTEDIYAEPGDILTLIEVPHTFAIFGAASRNAMIAFDADQMSLAEAVAKSRGLDDNLANPSGVFVFRWERRSVVRALGQPIAAAAPRGLSPVVYRFDLRDAKSYFFAREFRVHDKDVIFVADADTAPLKKVFEVIGSVVGPYRTALIVCRRTRC